MHYRWRQLTREFHCGSFLKNQQIIPKSLFDVNNFFFLLKILSTNKFVFVTGQLYLESK